MSITGLARRVRAHAYTQLAAPCFSNNDVLKLLCQSMLRLFLNSNRAPTHTAQPARGQRRGVWDISASTSAANDWPLGRVQHLPPSQCTPPQSYSDKSVIFGFRPRPPNKTPLKHAPLHGPDDCGGMVPQHRR